MSEESTNAADVRVGEPVVRIEGLRKSFGDNVVLRGIDLEVQRGEVVVILGPSGSGTTFPAIVCNSRHDKCKDSFS